MPTMNGLDAAQALKLTGCKVIMLTTFAKAEYFERAIKAGVRGYLLKDSPSKELVYSIRNTMDGKQIYSPELKDDKSSYNEQLVDVLITNEPLIKKSKIMGTVKNYFLIIIDKMKLPAG
jgi:two-component system response regulator DesR